MNGLSVNRLSVNRLSVNGLSVSRLSVNRPRPDWPVRFGLDLTYPNMLAKPEVIISQVTSRSGLSLLRPR